MPLSRLQSQLWNAMDIGPQWIMRSDTDPLLENPVPRPAAPAAAAVTRPSAAPRPAAALRPSTRSMSRADVVQIRPVSPSLKPPPRRELPVSVPADPPAPQCLPPDPQAAARIATASWADLQHLVDQCHACPMSQARLHTVFGQGQPGCPIVIVGEAPGGEEDLQGKPFVGKSGQLLTNILIAARLERGTDVALINVLKCRPPSNRDPQADEMTACRGFLLRQLELLEPRIIVLMGRIAAHALLGRDVTVSRVRKQQFVIDVQGRQVPAIVTYHPSFALRAPQHKENLWHDLLLARTISTNHPSGKA